MRVRIPAIVILVAASMLGLSVRTIAQTSMATLRGTVQDEQGGVLPGATVTARQVETNSTRSTVTNDRGQYLLPNLPAGTYELVAELSGFSSFKPKDVRLGVGQDFTVNVVLTITGVRAEITVSGQAALVETQSAVGTMIQKKDIDDLPTVSRDFSSLALLAPGTNSFASGTDAGMGVSFGGERQYESNILVDGASNLMQFYGRQANEFPQDWIQEFRVMTNSFGAEFGQSSGGLLNVITRSGTNTFTGRAYGFFRDDALDSPPFAGYFENGKPAFLTETPPFSEQRLGGFFGGPVVKNSLFFFAGIQNLHRRDSIVLAISDYWRERGVKTLLSGGTDDRPSIAKIDWNANERNRVSFRYTNTDKLDKNLSLGGSAIDTEENRMSFGGPLWNVITNWTTTLSDHGFNEARVFYGVNKPFITCNLAGAGGKALLDKAPLGTYSTKYYPGATFGCTGFTGLEGEANLFLMDNYSFMKGGHQVKIGGQMARLHMLMDVEAAHKGIWSFPEDLVFDINNPASYPDYFSGNIGSGVADPVKWNPGVFVQDTWQIRNDLTLNLGIRYDIDHTMTAGNELVDAYNTRIGNRLGGGPALQKIKQDNGDIAPRLGFVWVPTRDRRTTVRASYGRFYVQNHYNYTDIWYNETLLAERRIQFNANDPGANPFWPDTDALRAFLARYYPYYPDLSLAMAQPETILGLDPNYRIPHSTQLAGGFSHKFANGLDLQVDYVHSRGDDILVAGNRNWKLENGQWVPSDPRFALIWTFANQGWIRYHGLLSRAEYRRGTANLGISYTLARARSNTATGITGGGEATNPFDLSEDVGPDDSDRRHNLVVNGSYLFPLDFQAAGIWSYGSALPWSVSTRYQLDSDPFADRPEPRNSRRGDSQTSLDLRVSKNVRLRGSVVASVFWEMFNLFNTSNFTNYEGSLESSQFGLPLAAGPDRRQQFGFRVDF